MFKAGLRARIVFSLVLIVTATSVLFAVGLLTIKQKLEAATFGNMAREQLRDIIEQASPEHHLPDYQFIGGWQLYSSDEIAKLPEELRDLAPGSYHSLMAQDHYYQVEVADWNGQRLWLTFDITDWEAQEHEILEFLFYGALIVLVVAIVLGIQASFTILAPIRALTRRVSETKPHQRDVRIAKNFQGSEIGQIAAAFDNYMERLDQFVEREQSFTTAASHELRTPLSIIMGATDILETQSLSDSGQRALQRIDRACKEMLAFIEATLFIAREGSQMIAPDEPVDMSALLKELISENQHVFEKQKNRVAVEVVTNNSIKQPASVLKICVGNILRNANEHTTNGEINIRLDGKELTIEDNGEGIPSQHLNDIYSYHYTTKAEGSGMGLYLVKHICDRMNWSVEIKSTEGQGTTAELRFG